MEMKDHMLEIYKIEADKYNKTREIHWKMNFAIWTVLIVAIYAKSRNEFDISKLYWLWQLVIYTVFCGLHLYFIVKIHSSLDRSLARMRDMATIILNPTFLWDKIGGKKVAELATQKDGFFKWEYLQVLITVFLIAIFYFIPITQPK
jgi:hypothetical protein